MKKVETGRTATTMSNVLPAFQRHPYKIQNLILFLGQSAYEMRLSPKFIVIFKFGGFKGILVNNTSRSSIRSFTSLSP